MTDLVGIFLINVVFDSHRTELGEVLGRDLNQIRDGGLPPLVNKALSRLPTAGKLTRMNMVGGE